MATVNLTLRPNGNNSIGWTGASYVNIDDAVSQPTAGDGSIIKPAKANDNSDCDFDLDDCGSTIYNITSVVVWVYGYSTEADKTMEVNLNISGWQTEQTITFTGSYSWYSKTFTPASGTWTQAQMDAMLVRISSNTVANDNTWWIDTIYCYVTGDDVAPSSGFVMPSFV